MQTSSDIPRPDASPPEVPTADLPAPGTVDRMISALPPGLSVRSLTEADADRVVEVLAALEQAEPVDENWGVDDVLEQMRVPGIELERDGLGVFDGDRLVALGLLSVAMPPSEAFRAYLFGGVLPDYGHRGIGSAIVEEFRRRAAALRDRIAPELPGELKLWVESPRVGTERLGQSCGFEPWRWFFRMRRDLTDLVAPSAPVGSADAPSPVATSPVAESAVAELAVAGSAVVAAVAASETSVRPYRSLDEDAVRIARNQSFADHWGSSPMDERRWHSAFEGSATFRPAHSRVATAPDGSIAGFVMVSEFASDTAARGYATGHISLVGTVREARGRGLASALLASALVSLAADGYRDAELEVDADSPTGAGRIYQRLGFATVGRSCVMGRRF